MYLSLQIPPNPNSQWWKTKNLTAVQRVSVRETHDETGVTPKGISPHTELKHTNTTNRIYKYKASALQMKTRLQQTSTDTNTNIYRKQDQTGRTPMGRSPHREQQHKHTQAYTRSLLLVSITIQLLFWRFKYIAPTFGLYYNPTTVWMFKYIAHTVGFYFLKQNY